MRNLTKHTPHILAFLLLCTPYALFAQDFVPLSPDLPGLADKNIWDVSVEEMLNGIFMILIAVGAILAVLFFAISGIQYMATESITKKGMMKEGMTRVVVGILILIGGTLALSTINPGIIKIDLFETVKTQQ